jgi:hypothetical protein
MTGKTRAPERAPGLPVRLARLLIGPSGPRRPSDRIEGLLVMLLAAGFLVVIAAAPYFGERLYQSQRAGAAQLHAGTAVLTQNGPPDDNLYGPGEAAARWRAPDGRQQKGILTTTTAPGIADASAGARVQVWLSDSGQPQAPPMGAAQSMFASVVMAIGAVCGAAIVLIICYWMGRLALDRRRMAAWASEWTLIGPRWTTRL